MQKQLSRFHFVSLVEQVRKTQSTKPDESHRLIDCPSFPQAFLIFSGDGQRGKSSRLPGCVRSSMGFPVPLLRCCFHHDLSRTQTTGRAASTIAPSRWKTQLAFWSSAQRRCCSGNQEEVCVWLNYFKRWHFVMKACCTMCHGGIEAILPNSFGFVRLVGIVQNFKHLITRLYCGEYLTLLALQIFWIAYIMTSTYRIDANLCPMQWCNFFLFVIPAQTVLK